MTAPAETTWRIDRAAPDDIAHAAFATDRHWNGYSIADLAPQTAYGHSKVLAEQGNAPLRSESIQGWPGPREKLRLKGFSTQSLLDDIRDRGFHRMP